MIDVATAAKLSSKNTSYGNGFRQYMLENHSDRFNAEFSEPGRKWTYKWKVGSKWMTG